MRLYKYGFYILLSLLILNFLKNDLNSTSGYYKNISIRILEISGQRAKIAPYHNSGFIVYTKTNEEQWIDLKDLEF